MRVTNHKLNGVEYDAAHTIKGVITPKFLVMHYTAGYNLESARSVFNRDVVAAHLTIGTDGKMLQMVPFNRGANHAGPSRYDGVEYLNNHSIGIEHVNIGFLKKRGNSYIDAYDNTWRGNPADLIAARHSRVGGEVYYWPKYTQECLEASEAATRAILEAYPSIRAIVSHEEIDTRGWKTDPGPAFPMAHFQDILKNVRSGQGGSPAPVIDRSRVQVTADTLNVRKGPGVEYEMATKWPMHHGQQAELIGTDGVWQYVLINGAVKGWVHGAYTKRIG